MLKLTSFPPGSPPDAESGLSTGQPLEPDTEVEGYADANVTGLCGSFLYCVKTSI